MSKKETRRAARQAFPKSTAGTKASARARTKGSGGRNRGIAQRPLRPPSVKRSAIQGAALAVIYFIVMRLWGGEGATTASLIIFSVAAFFVYTGVAYAADKFTYQRRLRKLKGSSK